MEIFRIFFKRVSKSARQRNDRDICMLKGFLIIFHLTQTQLDIQYTLRLNIKKKNFMKYDISSTFLLLKGYTEDNNFKAENAYITF